MNIHGVEVQFIYHHTYHELLDTQQELTNIQGELYTGRNRKDVKPRDLWLAWQRDVQQGFQRYNDVPPHVMDFFQQTKHLNRPPEPGDSNLMETKPLRIKQQKNFSWSWTALNSFETCPHAYAEQRVYKTIPYVQSEAAAWGDRVHKAAENYFKGGAQDTEALPIVKPYCDALISSGGELLSEQSLAIDRALAPCSPTAWASAWGRGIIDVVVIKDETAYLYDFKTGKMKDDMTQLMLFCGFLALHRKDIDRLLARYIWIKDKKIAGMDVPLERKEIVKVWQDILPRVRRMEEAWKNEVFPMRANGLCRKFCQVHTCPHNGRYKG